MNEADAQYVKACLDKYRAYRSRGSHCSIAKLTRTRPHLREAVQRQVKALRNELDKQRWVESVLAEDERTPDYGSDPGRSVRTKGITHRRYSR